MQIKNVDILKKLFEYMNTLKKILKKSAEYFNLKIL
jgi:hypothetical protein